MFTVIAVILFCSVVQSLFGVGLLLFGTPSLLLLGYDFQTTLSILLPCSLTVGALQIFQDWRLIRRENYPAISFGLLALVLGLGLALSGNIHFDLKKLVGLLMLFNTGLRFSGKIQERLRGPMGKARIPLAILTGFVHGLTNMGGGLLTMMVSAIASSKETLRANVAFGYFMMGLFQMGVLIWYGKYQVQESPLLALPLLAGTTYLVVGKKLFKITNEKAFQTALTLFMGIFALLLLK